MLNTMPAWNQHSIEEVDRRAWEAICNWSEHGKVEVVREGIDYSHLIRSFLWDKVSRAVRQQCDPDQFEFEAQLLAPVHLPLTPARQAALPLLERLKRPVISLFAVRDAIRLKAQSRKPVLFVPYRNARLGTTITTLHQSAQAAVVVPYARTVKHDIGIPVRLPRRSSSSADIKYAGLLYEGVVRGLQAFDIALLPQDAETLKGQILSQVRQIRAVAEDLAFLLPQAILVFSDNHFPMQSYVHVARREGIPTIMLQHGLDCEHYCLEEAYASVIAVWGKARQQRYQQHSVRQPDRLQITGNPEYDHLHLPEKIDTSGDYWLWVTRPHTPNKCFSPSRSPHEGLDILAAFLPVLRQLPDQQLVIKPHPYDYTNLYQDYIDRNGLMHQVKLATASVPTLLPNASLVISEDSTAGLEAMFWGKRVIHAHFAACPPTVPFAAYDAALPAYSAEMLQMALAQVQQLTPVQHSQMLQGQRSFLEDYAGVCDGLAHQRILSLITEVVQR
ncbi:hypothetical protein IFO70_09895 [Phormidium tenue FACHB-886]|nr:hypothetical protein [Phormidium tenue FACHB-886]